MQELIAPDALIIGPEGFLISLNTSIGVHQESQYQQVKLEPSETDVQTYDHAGIRFDVRVGAVHLSARVAGSK